MRSHFVLTRIGLWTLPISGILFLIGYILNGALPDPSTGAVATMSAFAAPRFSLGAFINLVGMLLNPFGFFALYAYLTGGGSSRYTLLGLIFSILGLELTLTGYGVIVFDLPFLGQLFTQGKSSAEQGLAVATNPVFVNVLVFACFMYFIGSVLFGVALWRSKPSQKIVALGIMLSAFFLGFGPLLPMPALWGGILGALFLLTSGGWLAWHSSGRADLAA